MTYTQNAARIAKLLKRLAGASDREIAEATGLTRTNVNVKLNQGEAGDAGWSVEDLGAFAAAFDVPVSIFFMDYDEAFGWLAGNKPRVEVLDLRDQASKHIIWIADGLDEPSRSEEKGRHVPALTNA